MSGSTACHSLGRGVTLANAKALIYYFCAKLPSDKCVQVYSAPTISLHSLRAAQNPCKQAFTQPAKLCTMPAHWQCSEDKFNQSVAGAQVRKAATAVRDDPRGTIRVARVAAQQQRRHGSHGTAIPAEGKPLGLRRVSLHVACCTRCAEQTHI